MGLFSVSSVFSCENSTLWLRPQAAMGFVVFFLAIHYLLRDLRFHFNTRPGVRVRDD